MDRLTYMDMGCCQVRGADNRTCEEVCQAADPGCPGCPINEAFLRLKAYEDTGLTPEEIETLRNVKTETIATALAECLPQLVQAIVENLPQLVEQAVNKMAGEIQEGQA